MGEEVDVVGESKHRQLLVELPLYETLVRSLTIMRCLQECCRSKSLVVGGEVMEGLITLPLRQQDGILGVCPQSELNHFQVIGKIDGKILDSEAVAEIRSDLKAP